MRRVLIILWALASAGVAEAAEFHLVGRVRDTVVWPGTPDRADRTTVFLDLENGDLSLDELRIVFEAKDGAVSDLTWMGKNPPNQTKAPARIPALAGSTVGRAFRVTFAGPVFDRQHQDQLQLIDFAWLPAANPATDDLFSHADELTLIVIGRPASAQPKSGTMPASTKLFTGQTAFGTPNDGWFGGAPSASDIRVTKSEMLAVIQSLGETGLAGAVRRTVTPAGREGAAAGSPSAVFEGDPADLTAGAVAIGYTAPDGGITYYLMWFDDRTEAVKTLQRLQQKVSVTESAATVMGNVIHTLEASLPNDDPAQQPVTELPARAAALKASLAGVLPEKWAVRSAGNNAVPYNLGIKPGARRGTRVELVGPATVKGPRGINDEPESFTLWLMPADYTPVPPETFAQFQDAQQLGANEAMAVYCTSFTTGTPTWPDWKSDIVKALKLKAPTRPTAAPAEP